MTICAIIVTYQASPEIAARLRQILSQVDRLHIVDNGSPEARAALQEFAAGEPERVKLTLNNENIGLAAAQNMGIRQAFSDHFQWVLLLDDDSEPAPDMVEKLLAVGKRDKTLGIIAPRVVDRNTGKPVRYLVPRNLIGFTRRLVREGEIFEGAVVVIASGSLIRMEVFRAIGLMNEDMFIDYIDYDFALRARGKKFGIAVVGDARLDHAVGKKRAHGPIITSNHNARRRYTIFRNRFFILRRYSKQYPCLVLHEWLATLWDVLRIMLLEDDKNAKTRAAMRGLWQGLTEPLPPHMLR